MVVGAFVLGLLTVVLVAVASAAAGPTVTVRIEGESATLLPRTTVTLEAPEPVSGCPANSVAAAINLAVGGNWDHGEANNGGGDFTDTILGETHSFTHESDTWAEWVDYRWGGGICSDLLNNGDEVLMVADHEPGPSFAPTVLPLVVSGAPASIQVGTPFTVQVSAIHTPPGTFAERGEGIPEPLEGAVVSGGGVSATTGAGGVATITLTNTGNFSLRATKGGDAPSASFTVCAHNGNDGTCGTSGPSASSSSGKSGGSGVAGSHSSGRFAIAARIGGLREGEIFRPGRAPRLLEGTVNVSSGLKDVELRLTRIERRAAVRHSCAYYDGSTERFRPMRCGAANGRYFSIGSESTFSYLLPSALVPGRYVLDIKATDAAGDTTTLARGSTRIVFYVR